jgi:hypothetical protein
LGVGTNTPSQALHVAGAALIGNGGVDEYVYFDSTIAYVGRKSSTGDIWLNSAGSQSVVFGISGTAQAKVDANGNFLSNSGYGSAAIAYGCRAWVNFDGTTTPATIRGSGNVSSVSHTATGKYTVNFTNSLVDANYSTVVTSGKVDGTDDNNSMAIGGNAGSGNLQTSSYTYVRTGYLSGGIHDSNIVGVACFR